MLRWLGRLALSVCGGAVLVGTAWWSINHSDQQREIARLQAERVELLQIIDRLKNERRVAQLFVSDQKLDADGRTLETTVEFATLDAEGRPGPVKRLELAGDVCYIDALVIRFDNSYVEKGDPLRGHSLHLFRRMFGEGQAPGSGVALEEFGAVPAFYQTSPEGSRFEQQLWRRFWDYSSDPKLAGELGVRVAQGEAVYQRMKKGQLWELRTRADAGLEMVRQPVNPIISNHLSGNSVN